MTAIHYTALRSVKAGHTASDDYDLDIRVAQATRSRSVDKTVQVAQGGGKETLYRKTLITWQITSPPLSPTELLDWIEFLDSTDRGESFTLDPYGSVATPDDPQTYTMQGDGYTLSRVVKRGGGGAADYFAVSFTAERFL